jgi:GH25 family lysozyme M1 (1,4-beta-N-acetylmuramidase)
VPRGAGGADGDGSGSVSGTVPTGQPGPGAAASGGDGITPLSRTAGQGDIGPLPAGTVPADGAVPGASPAIQAMAAAREANTGLSHSPQLLAQLKGAAGTGGAGADQAGSPQDAPAAGTAPSTGASSPAASPAATAASPTASASSSAVASTAPAAAPTASVPPTATAPPTASSSPAGGVVPAAAVPQATAPAPRAPRTLAGLDVAGFQHPVSKAYPDGEAISWTAVAAAGYKFAAVKATEGDYYVNPWASTDLAAARDAGLDVAPYHFAVPNVSGGAEQAQFAVEYSGYVPGARMLPLMLDIEYDPYVATDHTNECYGLTPAKMTAWLAAFVTTVRSLTGQYPVIYTTADWWDTCTGRSAAFGADPMWVAAYGFASPPVPAGWNTWTFWQYTSDGTVPGVATPGTTDLDSFSPAMVGLIDPGGQSSVTGARVSLPAASLGAMAGETLKYTAASLPPGLSVTAAGTISGTVATAAAPAKAATYRVTFSAANAAGATATASFSWRVSPACARSPSPASSALTCPDGS